jgi:hypothetical protein
LKLEGDVFDIFPVHKINLKAIKKNYKDSSK